MTTESLCRLALLLQHLDVEHCPTPDLANAATALGAVCLTAGVDFSLYDSLPMAGMEQALHRYHREISRRYSPKLPLSDRARLLVADGFILTEALTFADFGATDLLTRRLESLVCRDIPPRLWASPRPEWLDAARLLYRLCPDLGPAIDALLPQPADSPFPEEAASVPASLYPAGQFSPALTRQLHEAVADCRQRFAHGRRHLLDTLLTEAI
ncbi:MAG: hypothetical protein ACI353_03535 [Alloprevotella sp.]